MDREESYKCILEARRVLDEYGDDCEILEDLKLFGGKWLLKLKLKNRGDATEKVPLFTSWHVVIDLDYPRGIINFYPSKEDGITSIFPHQSPHTNEESEYYYNSNICLEQYSPDLRRESNNTYKLYSYVSKALDWIEAASTNSLLQVGEPFEIVAYPFQTLRRQILFTENRESFLMWQKVKSVAGFCNLKSGSVLAGQDNMLFYLTDFYEGEKRYKNNNSKVISYGWGDYVTKEKTEEKKGIWIKLKTMPLIEPWEAPRTWTHLIKILNSNGVKFEQEIVPLLNELRDGLNHFMILGFPIPEITGEENTEYFWQGIELPILSNPQTSNKYFNGFRKNNIGYNYVDRKLHFNNNTTINWISSENWAAKNLISRGSLPRSINQLSYLLVGVGSVGSKIVDLMVRMGIRKVDIVDPDLVLIGNLTRHELSATDLYQGKARQMVEKISKSNIHFTGKSYYTNFDKFIQNNPQKIAEYDVVIETTGENEVLEALDALNVNSKVFSISIGLGAKRLYINSNKSSSQSFNNFLSIIQPWLDKDVSEFSGVIPRDGIGCWHPLFPARLDHINLLCSSAVSIMEKDLIDDKDYMTVIERGDLGTTKIIIRDENI
ncbi:ThiF family adenylyltransferase [Alkalibacterium olivapovliticus]|uniref:ThiF family protein n=1 Tax=Alkalibacterium olivapovliticus TaxID=99907 RepID=A0A2T0VT13_9LACT|nr:ThiF family adenylyltransferase [Alkalibacterium olivapovliticus]PRY73819.1 ThiF family protein [Alkalibacterium olivapovliticus]